MKDSSPPDALERQIRRPTKLLMRLKSEAERIRGKNKMQNEGKSYDVIENIAS